MLAYLFPALSGEILHARPLTPSKRPLWLRLLRCRSHAAKALDVAVAPDHALLCALCMLLGVGGGETQ